MSDPQVPSARALRMRGSVDRLADVAADRLGARPFIAEPADPAGIPDMAGRRVPAEVRDLYSIADVVAVYDIQLAPARRLPEINDEADEFMAEYPLLDLGDLPWGPPPVGDSLVVGSVPVPIYVAEMGGQPSGVTMLTVGDDEGYRWMAPSLERLLETWVVVAEAGLIELGRDAGGNRRLLPRREGQDVARAERVCHSMSCSLAALGLYGVENAAFVRR